MAKAKTPAKPIADRPKKGPGSGKPNRAMKAKAAGISTHLPPPPGEEPIIIALDHPGTVETRVGAPSLLTPDLGSRVCSLVAQGLSLDEIAEIEGMPARRTVYRWIAHGGEGEMGRLYEQFRLSLARARVLRATARADQLEDLRRRLLSAPEPGSHPLDPASARVAKDITEFLMAVEDPGTFAKRVTVQGDKKNPVEVHNRHTLDDASLLAIAAGMDIDKA